MTKKVSVLLFAIFALLGFSNASAFNVTPGMSGAWYDPSHDGEGYFLQVMSETKAVAYWFTYDKSGNQYWMVGVGRISGSKITVGNLKSVNGGKFGPEFDPDDVVREFWGELEFDFSSCDAGTATYSGPPEFGSGTLNVERLSTLWGLDCDGDYANPQLAGEGFLSTGFSGSWYDFNHDGEGFVVEMLSETKALVIWFTFDTYGNPAWLLGTGKIHGATIVVNNLKITSGGTFGPEFNPDEVTRESWGSAAFTFGSCGDGSAAGNMRYIPPPEFGPESSQFLYRLVSINGVQCDFLTDTYSVEGSMTVAENIFLDGDVNNPAVAEVSNDLDASAAQQLVPPAKVAGFATAVATTGDGDRFADEIDEWDVYVLAIKEGESVSLDVSDWDSGDTGANDLDLYLVNVNDPDTTVDSSVGTNQTEWVTAPEDGNYFVFVHAYSGTSNYLLKSGQNTPQAATKLSASAAMETGEIIAGLRSQSNLLSTGGRDSYKSRIEKSEKENGLTRLEESGYGDVLYSVDTKRIDQLVPHPLTLVGRGSITPENWHVIKTAKRMLSSENFRWVGPNYIQYQMAIPNDQYYSHQWHYPLIRLPQAWDITTGSSDIVVSVIDSGIYDHPDLMSNVDYALGYDFVAYSFMSGDGDGIDPYAHDPGKLYPVHSAYKSHGTHVAGTIGATGNNGIGITGVNWDVTIMPVRVFGVNGRTDCRWINEALKWSGRLPNASGSLPSRKADIVNLSLGGYMACPGTQEIIDQLVAQGIVIIAAAGNDSTARPAYPAAFPNVISVSATTVSDEFAYSYSNFGSSVDVAAPGGDRDVDLNNDGFMDGVLSTLLSIDKGSTIRNANYGFLPGTSMASPHVAGIAALMKSVYPAMGPNEFFTAISSGEITADLGPTSKDPMYGYGRIDAQKAVNWAWEQNQGQDAGVFLTSSISAANFGSNQQSVEFEISKGGKGSISVTGGGTTETWLTAYYGDVDEDGVGTYSLVVDRTDLIDGSYFGWAAIDVSDGSRIWISVAMQVGDKVAGEAGHLYALLLDTWTYGNVKQWDGFAIDGDHSISLESNPPGTYYLLVGSDIDNDYSICDPGEFCHLYPLNSQAGVITVSDEDVQLGTFTMGFPGDDDSGNIASAEFGSSSEDGSDHSEIRTIIANSGVLRRK